MATNTWNNTRKGEVKGRLQVYSFSDLIEYQKNTNLTNFDSFPLLTKTLLPEVGALLLAGPVTVFHLSLML